LFKICAASEQFYTDTGERPGQTNNCNAFHQCVEETVATVRHALDEFVARQNVKHYRELLDRELDQTEQQRVLGLLEEEETKLAMASEPLNEPGKNPSQSIAPNAHASGRTIATVGFDLSQRGTLHRL
jgi:hypothetical protein